MSTSRRADATGRLAWLARPAAAWLLIAISPLASPDELVMRPGMRLKDKQVYSFDEDGVLLGPAARPIGWEEIEGGTLARDQARFDRMRRELGGPLHEIHTGLADGAYAPLLEPAQALFPRFADRRSNSAYMVAQALMWANLALHQSEAAIEPYLVCVTLRQTVRDLGSLPGRRRLQSDSQTGLSPELPLVGFDRKRAAAALPQVRARIRKLGTASPPALALYVAGLALAADDAATAEAALTALASPARPVAEIADALRAQAVAVRGQKADALLRLERMREGCLPSNRGLVDYLTGAARLEIGKGNPGDGVLDLLNVAALHGDDQPALAAAALYRAQRALLEQHDAAGARAVQIELLRSFPQTDQRARMISELGPDSAVARAAADLDAAESKADAGDSTETEGRGPGRSSRSDGQPPPRKRTARPKAKENPK
jgi:hypothetical protein